MKDILNQGFPITIKVTVDGRPFGEFRKFDSELSGEEIVTQIEDMMCNTLRGIGEAYTEEES